MQNWEYAIVELSGGKDKDMVPALDRGGSEGWELVSVVVSFTKDEYLAFFKRPVK
jgi:hypothetical protein